MSLQPRAVSARRFTVAIVVTDDHVALSQTLASARAIADEVVVIDAGTKPKSTELAAGPGLVHVYCNWDQDLSALRNAALERATGDWVLWLEPGETISADAGAALRQFVLSEADSKNIYLLVVTVPPLAGDISGEQVAQIRLLPRDGRLRYRGRVRERLEPGPDALGLASEGLPWRIARRSRATDPRFTSERARRNLKLVELDLAERGMQPCLLAERGEALAILHDQRGAAKAFREAIAVSLPTSGVQREAYYGLLTTYVDPSDRPTQIQICLEALEKFPLDAQLLCAMGGYMQAEGRMDLSAQAYRSAFEFGQIDPQTWHIHDIHEIAAICLSLTHQLRSNAEEEQRVLEHMLARRSESHRVRRHLIELHIRHDRRKDALAEFDCLPADTPYREALRSAVRGACLAAKRNWVPAAAYLQTAYAAGCRDLLCLRWLAATLMATGQNEAALPIIQEWKALDPRSLEADKYLENLAAAEARPQLPDSAPPKSDTRRLRVDAPLPGAAAAPLPLSNLALGGQTDPVPARPA